MLSLIIIIIVIGGGCLHELDQCRILPLSGRVLSLEGLVASYLAKLLGFVSALLNHDLASFNAVPVNLGAGGLVVI